MIDLPRAFLLVAEEVKAGTFTPKVETFGLASGVIRYVSNPRLDSLVPAALKARVAAAADSIAKGTLLPVPGPRQSRHSAIHHGAQSTCTRITILCTPLHSAPLW